MKRFLVILALTLTQFACAPEPDQKPAEPAALLKTGVDQGPQWFRNTRAAFYTQDQGSRLMPLRWFRALKQENGQPFMADNLSRYGYLENKENAGSSLPVGFTTNGPVGNESIGMNCAACHTREIEVGIKVYRIDGGPAIADFQSFLRDLDKAVGKVAKDPVVFNDFAAAVLEGNQSTAEIALLRQKLKTWYLPFHTIVDRALPQSPWGPGRLDAVGMIFNRLTGLDIGPAWKLHLIPENIRRASAPTRYPFIWNAAIQDRTQWPGFAANGNDLLGLARNIGEVIGVFAEFYPQPDPNKVLKIDYSSNNSANTEGLMALEDLIKRIGAPRYQWPVDQALAKAGEEIFNWPTSRGSGCADCHGIRLGKDRLTGNTTWVTPLQDVGTDSREYDILKWTAKTGVLNGARIPLIGKALKPVDSSFSVLGLAVEGTILQRLRTVGRFAMASDEGSNPESLSISTSDERADSLKGAFTLEPATDKPFKYEARVMQGIWAVAPYLHNGSVPTLADLLEPVSNRPKSFQIGPKYDPTDKVGLAAEQTRFPDFTLNTTDCSQRNSGVSNCGHEFGVGLKPEEKKALLEYLKTL